MVLSKSWISPSKEETQNIGKKLLKELLKHKKNIVAFYGDLGSGKTQFIKGIASALNIPENAITSPTFTYLNIYPSTPSLHHFDLYRLGEEKTFLEMGFLEFFDQEEFCVIEWAEKIPNLLPPNAVKIKIAYINESSREITIEGIRIPK